MIGLDLLYAVLNVKKRRDGRTPGKLKERKHRSKAKKGIDNLLSF